MCVGVIILHATYGGRISPRAQPKIVGLSKYTRFKTVTEIEFIPLSGGAHLGANAFLLRIQISAEIDAQSDENNAPSEPQKLEILLDAGATSTGQPKWLNDLQQPDLVWISHVHWDHIGALPHLVERFRRLPVLASTPSCELAGLAMSFASGDKRKTLARSNAIAQGMRAMKYRTYYELDALTGQASNMPVRLMTFEAGHLLGAAMLLIEIDRVDQHPFRVLYSGDFCTHDQAWLPGAAIPRPSADFQIDVFICEGVLATDTSSDEIDYDTELRRMLNDCLTHVGPRLVAVSALGESCEIVAALSQAIGKDPQNDDVLIVHEYFKPIFDVYSRYMPELKSIRYADTRVCAQMLKTGALVVAGGDQLQNGTVAGELALEIIGDIDAEIVVFNGVYPQTPAGKLLAAASGAQIKLAGRSWTVNAQRHHYCLPLHAPRWQLIETARALNAQKIVLVHGHERQLYSLRRSLAATLNDVEIMIPKNGETINLFPTS